MSTIDSRTEAGILILYLQDVRIIDERQINFLGEELNRLLRQTQAKRAVINFEHVSFMSSAMIGKLVDFHKQCKELNVKLRLCEIGENLGEIFSLMRLDKVFQIDADEEASVNSFPKTEQYGA